MPSSIAAATMLDPIEADDPEAPPTEPVYVAAVDRRRGTAWLVQEAKRIQDENPELLVVVDEKRTTNGTYAFVLKALKAEGDNGNGR